MPNPKRNPTTPYQQLADIHTHDTRLVTPGKNPHGNPTPPPIRQAITAINNAQPGWPTGGTGSTPPPDAITGTIVERIALTAATGRPDPAITAQRRLEELSKRHLLAVIRLADWNQATLAAAANSHDPHRRLIATTMFLTWLTPKVATGDTKISDPHIRALWIASYALADHVNAWARLAQPIAGTTDTDRKLGIIDTENPLWCISCLRLGHCEPRTEGKTRCRWCAGFHATHTVDPPITILERHHRGERIYERDITLALRKRPAC